MGIHKVDDIIIYTNSPMFDDACMGENIEQEIAEWIVDHYEYNIILDILNKNYEGLHEKDKKAIIGSVVSNLSYDRSSREKKIENCLKNYLKTDNEINLQGFVRFRLKEYRNGLEKVVDNTVDEYLVEKEYYAFIDLLKEFISYQTPLIDVLNIRISRKRVDYYNEKGENIKEYIEKTVYTDEELTQEDKLLTVLLMTAPERINIRFENGYENDEIKKTIEMIFGEKIKFI